MQPKWLWSVEASLHSPPGKVIMRLQSVHEYMHLITFRYALKGAEAEEDLSPNEHEESDNASLCAL